jgi:hypothetical protein
MLKRNFNIEQPALELEVAQGCREHHLSVVGHMTFACLFELTSRTMETGFVLPSIWQCGNKFELCLSRSLSGRKMQHDLV